jgi:HK97 family phage major capsid protein
MAATDELTLPDSLEKARAMLNDPAEINRWLQARRFTDLQDRYNELERPPLPQQIAEILDAREAANGTVAKATREAMDQWLAERGMNIARPAMGGNETPKAPPRNIYARKMEEIGFTNIGDFAKEIWHKNTQAKRLEKINEVMNAFSSYDPASGGYLIPESMDNEIRSLTLEESIVRSRATVIPMSTPQMLFPFVDWTTNVGSTFGGWTVSRVGEGATITPSTAKFGRVKLDVTKQVAGAEVPNEMFSDVAALDGFIRRTLPQAKAFAEDKDFLVGTGVGEPLGALASTNTALITVTKETNQAASTVVIDNILKMYARMLPSSKGRAVWIVNPTTFVQLQQLSIAVGTGGAPVMLVNLANGPVPTMLGRPIIETEKVPALGSAADISFIDFTYYLIGDRPGSGLESSPHAQFMNDVTVMKLTDRNDGRPWIQSPFTPTNGDSLSPFVTLGARS